MQREPPFAHIFNPLNAELNSICHLLALLGAHPILHISRIKVNRNSFTNITHANAALHDWDRVRSPESRWEGRKPNRTRYGQPTAPFMKQNKTNWHSLDNPSNGKWNLYREIADPSSMQLFSATYSP